MPTHVTEAAATVPFMSLGQLELRVNQQLTDPSPQILSYGEFGRVSTLATATLRQMGFLGAVALDGGMKAWHEAGCQVKAE